MTRVERVQRLHDLSDEDFRTEFRAWLDANYPEAWRQDSLRPFRRLRGDEHLQWVAMLYAAGWRSPAWPVEHGGLGLPFRKQAIYQEELDRARASRVIDLGDVQLGPTLILFGTEDQKREYLPAIQSGAHIWCQGYSEPNAGSDLASLKTTAERRGDKLVVNGQKIWTTHADEATHIFALVRTARLERKQQGITFLLIDMKTPGITVRPIANLAGEEEFCEVFFDDVEVPVANVVGAIDDGWTVAKALLGYERVWTGSPALCMKALTLSRLLLDGAAADAALADRYAELAADLGDIQALYRQTCNAVGEGREPGPEVSILKIFSSELLQAITEFNLEIGGDAVARGDGMPWGETTVDLPWQYYMARPGTIFAGSNEVQRDILARVLLKLPTA